MRMPPFLMGITILFWGWQSNLLPLALGLATAIELSWFVKQRWQFSTKDYNNLLNLCFVIISGIIFYLIIQEKVYIKGFYNFIELLPIAFYPLLLGQAYNSPPLISINKIFFIKIHRRKTIGRKGPLTFNFALAYFFLCLMAAAMNKENIWLYILAIMILLFWLLWAKRSPRYSWIIWGGAILFCGLLSVILAFSLRFWQGRLEKNMVRWLTRYLKRKMDPYKIRTGIGAVGDKKNSARIMVRVDTPPATIPLHIQEAVYNVYKDGSWYAIGAPFRPLPNQPGSRNWLLAQTPSAKTWALRIWDHSLDESSILKSTLHSYKIANLGAEFLYRNHLGTIRIEKIPSFLHYTLIKARRPIANAPPDKYDIGLGPQNTVLFGRLVAALQIKRLPDDQKIKAIERFFQVNFHYDLDTAFSRTTQNYLSQFLHVTQSGHCEYFATATVLLLRAAGIPARYAVGYMVNEYSQLEEKYIVRANHGHAWALAYYNGFWQNVDTTPAIWLEKDTRGNEHWTRFIGDSWSWLLFNVNQLRWRILNSEYRIHLLWIIILLILFLAARLYFGKKMSPKHNANLNKYEKSQIQFFLKPLLQFLQKQGLQRPPGKPLLAWLQNQKHFPFVKTLIPIIKEYYRLRFDPQTKAAYKLKSLKNKLKIWLQEHYQNKQC